MERSLIVVQTVDRNPFRRPSSLVTIDSVSPRRLVSSVSEARLVSSVRAGYRSVVRSIRRRSRQHSCHAPLLLLEQ